MGFEIPYRSYIAEVILDTYHDKCSFSTALTNAQLSNCQPVLNNTIKNQIIKAQKNPDKLFDALQFANNSFTTKSVAGSADVPMLGELNVLTYVFQQNFSCLVNIFPCFSDFFSLARKYSYNQQLQAIQVRKELTDEWDARGVQKGVEYAILTDEISRAWSGMSTRQYKNLKGLKKENLRDNMTTLELVLNMLAEATTTEISKQKAPETFSENLAVAREGGEAAGIARKAVEERTGVPVITSKNAAQLNQVVTDLLEGATVQSEKQDKEQ